MNDTKKNHRLRSRLGWGAAALLAVALGAWALRPRPLGVEVATVRIAPFEQAIEEDGRLRLKHRYQITAPTAADLQRPALRVGDTVRAGDPVATLAPAAPPMIDARTRAVLEQRAGSADAARRAAAAQLQRLQTALAQADLEAERATQLARDNFIAPAARDQAVLARRAAQQALDAGRAELRAAEFGLAEAQAALQRAQAGGGSPPPGLWVLKSPVDGQVIKLHLDSAGPVGVGQPLLEIGDASAVEAVIDVLSGDVARIAPGAPVRLLLGGGAAPLAARVTRIEPVAFTKVSALGIEEQRVNVIAELEPAAAAPQPGVAPRLGEGYRVDARITLSAHDAALQVPSAALLREGRGWQVLVVAGGRAHARAVTLRDRHADAAWVAEGLREGETVVLYPGNGVADGQAVAVRPVPR